MGTLVGNLEAFTTRTKGDLGRELNVKTKYYFAPNLMTMIMKCSLLVSKTCLEKFVKRYLKSSTMTSLICLLL